MKRVLVQTALTVAVLWGVNSLTWGRTVTALRTTIAVQDSMLVMQRAIIDQQDATTVLLHANAAQADTLREQWAITAEHCVVLLDSTRRMLVQR